MSFLSDRGDVEVELRIREFRKGDMDALFFLNERCLAPTRRATYRELLDTLLDRDVGSLVAEEVAEGYSRLVAGLVVQGDPWNSRLFILALMVDAEYRRLGIARRLLAWAERFGRGFNCTSLLLPLEAGNAEGQAFLAAAGFHESDEHAPFFSEPSQGTLWSRDLKADEPAS